MGSVGPFLPVGQVLLLAEKGDLIEVRRSGAAYKHWAVYVGGGYAIHVYLPSKLESLAVIKQEKLEDICDGDNCRINNLTKMAHSKGLVAQTPNDIVMTAEAELGNTIEYRILSENCEYFATACRYGHGEAFCGQVEGPSNQLISFGTAAAVVGACALFVGSVLKSLASRNPNRRQ